LLGIYIVYFSTLFLIFINSIVKELSYPIQLFADDTTLFIVVDNPVHTADLLTSGIHNSE